MGEHQVNDAGELVCPDKGGTYRGEDYPQAAEAGTCPACGASFKPTHVETPAPVEPAPAEVPAT